MQRNNCMQDLAHTLLNVISVYFDISLSELSIVNPVKCNQCLF